MKLEKYIEKLVNVHGSDQLLNTVIKVIDSPKVLLQLSNYFVLKSNEGRILGDKDQEKLWRKRAKVVHELMEEINGSLANNL